MASPLRLVVDNELSVAANASPAVELLIQRLDELQGSLRRLVPHLGTDPSDWTVRSTQAQLRLARAILALRAAAAEEHSNPSALSILELERPVHQDRLDRRLVAVAGLIVQLSSARSLQQRERLKATLLAALPRLDRDVQLLHQRLDRPMAAGYSCSR